MAARIPHTYRRNGTYYVRLKWPAYIRNVIPRLGNEFNCSLRTTDPQQAALNAYACALKFKQLVEYINKSTVSGTIDAIASRHDVITTILKNALSYGTRNAISMAETELDTENRIEIIDDLTTGKRTYRSDLSDPDENMVEIITFTQKSGGGSGGYIPHGPTVEAVAELLAEDLRVLGDWADQNTHKQGLTRLAEVVKILGPTKHIDSFTRIDIIGVRRDIKSRIDPDKTRRTPRDGKMSADTARSYFQLCTRLFRFAYDEGFITVNVASELSIRVNEKKQEKASYRTFTDVDLNKIVNGYIYTATELERSRTILDSYFWVMLLAMYTGGRINEICQLCIKDVIKGKSKDGTRAIWYMSINDDEYTQSVKTESSIRKVPLHNVLIELGFVDYFNQRKISLKQNDQLFEKMKYCKKNGWGRETGRWFNGETAVKGYLDTVNLDSRENKSFHSFRHTAAQALREVGVDEADIAATVGHEHPTVTRRYGSGYSLERLKKVIDQLDYGLDLSHISYKAFQDYKACKGRPIKNKHLLYVSKKR